MGSAINTTTPGLLTSLTMAAILEIFISERISMNFGMVDLEQLLKHMGSCKVVLNENLLGTRLTSLTMAAILEIFISQRISMNFGMVDLEQLLKHMGSCKVVLNENLLGTRLTSLTMAAILEIFIYG